MKENQIPACHFSYNEHCEEQTKTCQQCPVYWEFNNIDPEEGLEDKSDIDLSDIEFKSNNTGMF